MSKDDLEMSISRILTEGAYQELGKLAHNNGIKLNLHEFALDLESHIADKFIEIRDKDS